MPNIAGIYESPQTVSEDGNYVRPPRIPNGRSPILRAPNMSTRTTSGPSGDTTTTAVHNLPYSAPQVPPINDFNSDHERNLRNWGLAPRGASGVGHSAPMLSAPTNAVASSSPQMSGPPTISAPQMTFSATPGASPGAAPPAPGINGALSPTQQASLDREYRKFSKYASDHEKAGGDFNDPNYKFWQKRLGEIRGLQTPTQGAASAPGNTQQPVQQPAQSAPSSPQMPYTNPDTGSPQMRAPITDANRINTNDSEFLAKRNESLGTMWKSYQQGIYNNPTAGTQPVPAPVSGFNYTNAAARDAVDAGPDVQARNEGAIARGYNSKRDAVIRSNADQIATNQRGSELADTRLKSINSGVKKDYNDPNSPVIAGRQGRSQPGASQQGPVEVTSAEQHAALPNGTPFTWNGKQYIKGQQGQ